MRILEWCWWQRVILEFTIMKTTVLSYKWTWYYHLPSSLSSSWAPLLSLFKTGSWAIEPHTFLPLCWVKIINQRERERGERKQKKNFTTFFSHSKTEWIFTWFLRSLFHTISFEWSLKSKEKKLSSLSPHRSLPFSNDIPSLSYILFSILSQAMKASELMPKNIECFLVKLTPS